MASDDPGKFREKRSRSAKPYDRPKVRKKLKINTKL